jgi:hypothetical protein
MIMSLSVDDRADPPEPSDNGASPFRFHEEGLRRADDGRRIVFTHRCSLRSRVRDGQRKRSDLFSEQPRHPLNNSPASSDDILREKRYQMDTFSVSVVGIDKPHTYGTGIMSCDLELLYGSLCDQFEVVDDQGNPDIDFTVMNDSLPTPPAIISSAQIIIRKSWHMYLDSLRIDSAYIYAEKRTLRQLGLLILGTVFSTKVSSVRLNLTHGSSGIRFIEIDSTRVSPIGAPSGYTSQPFLFRYAPFPVESYNPLHQPVEHHERDYPTFSLTNEEEFVATDEQWKGRDVIKGFGTAEGSALFAELLLNISLPATRKTEFDLEAFPGYRSVSRYSIEARIILPGDEAWVDRLL